MPFQFSSMFQYLVIPNIALLFYTWLSWFTTRPWIWFERVPFPFRLSSKELLPSVRTLSDDELTWKHHAYVTFNRAIITPIYAYCLYLYIINDTQVNWGYNLPNLFKIDNGLSLIYYTILFIIEFLFFLGTYDFFYYFFHRWMHLPSIYPYIHKHHHSHLSPFRGTYDGADTHPFEMIIGIYLHLFTLIIGKLFFLNLLNIGFISGYAYLLFHIFAGFFNSLNHTRFGLEIPFLYDSRDHDIHHRIPNANYATSLMLWDKLFGTYRAYYTPKTA